MTSPIIPGTGGVPPAPKPRVRKPKGEAPIPPDAPVVVPDVPAETEQVIAAAEADAVRKRRSLLNLPKGWEYEVNIINGYDRVSVHPTPGGGYAVTVDLGGRTSVIPADDLSAGLDVARGLLKTYAAYKEQVLAFDNMLGLAGTPANTEVTRGHADANSVTTAADVEQVMAGEGAGVTVAESEIAR